MSRSRFILFASDDAWRVGICGDSDDTAGGRLLDGPIAPNASAVLEVLKQHGYLGDAILLALPSAWCLSATISTTALPRRDRREAMAFRLEDQLPISAEEFTAAFIETSSDTALGVCVQQSRLDGIVRSLNECGIAVQSIVPAVLLSIQDLLNDVTDSPDVVTTVDGNFFTLRERKLRSWAFVTPEHVQRHVQLEAIRHGGPIRVARLGQINDPAAIPDTSVLAVERSIETIDCRDKSIEQRSIRCAAGILRGMVQPWIDLRGNRQGFSGGLQLLRGSLAWATAGAIFFSLSLTAAALWRAHGYSRAVQFHQLELQRIYQSVQPGQPMPDGIKSRLISDEHRMRGLVGDGVDAPHQISALPELYRILAHLPTQVRWRIQDILLEDGRLELEGEARSHSDADAIAVALREAGGFNVDSPRTEQLQDGGVALTVTGTLTGTVASSGGSQ